MPVPESAKRLRLRLLSHLSNQLDASYQEYQDSRTFSLRQGETEKYRLKSSALESDDFVNDLNISPNLEPATDSLQSETNLPRATVSSNCALAVSQTPIPPTPQLVFTPTPFSASTYIRPISSSGTWADSAYGTGVCGHPDCISNVGCLQCADLSLDWDSNTAGTNLFWSETPTMVDPILLTKSSDKSHEKDDSAFHPIISTADMDQFLARQFSNSPAENA